MKCPKCKAENPDYSRFCNRCGCSLIDIPTPPMSMLTQEIPKKSSIDFSAGQHFGKRYQIIEEIGQGGMGRVYKTLDKELNRIVALKMIKPELSDSPSLVKRFKKELLLASKVTQKNVCRIHDLGEAEGIKFISMQFIDGKDLKQFILQAGKLVPEKVLSITKQICAALQAAHDEGVIHRDLKPQNIMIDRQNKAYVMDFGIAKSIEAKETTKPGIVVGSPEYMSPEQVKGQGVSPRSDIYSLGVIMYEMLTGKMPFKSSSIEGLIHKHLKETPELPSTAELQIPKALGEIILKCLEKDPKKRFQRADEIIKAIDKIKLDIISTTQQLEMPKKSIAVLPFTDLSQKKDHEYFCDGLSEELINSLTKIKGLWVVARTSAFSFKGEKLDVREIGKKLDVQTILEGSVRKADNKLRITAQLINIADGYHLWSDKYDCDMEDIFTIQDEISIKIVNALRIKLGVEEKNLLAKRSTKDPEAYNLYLKGRHFFHKITEEGFQKGMKYFQQTIEKDPNNVFAYAGIAGCYNLLAYYEYLPPNKAFTKAKAAADKALEIDDNIAEVHTSLAWIKMNYELDFTEAEREYMRAIELKPTSATAHSLFAYYLAATGRYDESIAEAKRAQELDPLSLMINTNLGAMFYLARQHDLAIVQLNKTLEIDQNYILAHYFLGLAYAGKGMYNEAIAEMEKAIHLLRGRESPILRHLGIIYSLSGKRRKAKQVLNELLELSKQKYVSPWGIALMYMGFGEKDQALEWLEKAYKQCDHWILHIKEDPLLDNMRYDPRLIKLLKKMGLA